MSHSTIIKGVRRTVLAALGITVLGIGSAWATPVSSWNYTSAAEFATTGPDAPTFTPGSSIPSISTTQIAWGTPYPPENPTEQRSSLVINPFSGSGTVSTYTGGGTPSGGYISDPGIQLTHNNYSVTQANGGWLKTATLLATINLTSPLYPGNPISLTLPILFDETNNTAGGCPVPPESGFLPCPDIFVLGQDSLDYSFFFPDPDDGSINRQYFLSLFPATGGAIGTLSDAACSAAGAASGCFGFITQENAANDLHFGLTISTTPFTRVPEPGTLGMVGLGLLAIVGLAIRRRKPSVQ